MAPLDPFDYLVKLSQTIRSAGPQLPAESEVKHSWSGIGFSVLGQRMVAPLGEVVEMLHVPGTTRLPGVQEWVLGLANVRGRLLPLFDLEMFLGGKLSNNKARHRVLVLEMSDLYAGLVVSDAYGMQHFPQGLDAHELPQAISHLQPYSQGAYEHNGTLWTSFSPYNLIRDPRFFNAAAA